MNHESGFDDFKSRVRTDIEQGLAAAFANCPSGEVCEVARYVAIGGGHRWRALVTIAAGQVFHDNAMAINLPGACAVELAHAASMLLDDLPSMDDAAIRRGKPCAHTQFQSWAVDMAPAWLVTLAFDLILRNPLASTDRRIEAALEVSRAAYQMAAGQELDLGNSSPNPPIDESELLGCYRLKSSALYAASARAGALLCGASEQDADRMKRCGELLGLSYQFLDDVADVEGQPGQLGKPTGQDLGKVTAVTLLGVSGARSRSESFQEQALGEIAGFGPDAAMLRQIVRHASWATH